jgi:hypothetical protein
MCTHAGIVVTYFEEAQCLDGIAFVKRKAVVDTSTADSDSHYPI